MVVRLRPARPLPSAMSRGPREHERQMLAACPRAQTPPAARHLSRPDHIPLAIARVDVRLEERERQRDAMSSWKHVPGLLWMTVGTDTAAASSLPLSYL
jgi:hypothetical protein